MIKKNKKENRWTETEKTINGTKFLIRKPLKNAVGVK